MRISHFPGKPLTPRWSWEKVSTVATAVLAHSIAPAHQLQHRVEVASDGLQAPPEGVQPPVFCLVLGRGPVGGCSRGGCGLLGGLAQGSALEGGREQQQQQQQGSEEGPAGHPEDHHSSQTDRRQQQAANSAAARLNFEPGTVTTSYVEGESPACEFCSEL